MNYPKSIVVSAALIAAAIASAGRPMAQSASPSPVAAAAGSGSAWVVIGEAVFHCNPTECKKIK